jgi:hypothetical protein
MLFNLVEPFSRTLPLRHSLGFSFAASPADHPSTESIHWMKIKTAGDDFHVHGVDVLFKME